jgi:hypothetical protein
MGDGADFFLEILDDLDEAYCDGKLIEDTNYSVMSPFLYEQKEHGPGNCPICKGETHPINGRYGWFYGCNNFPNCNGRRGW